MAAFFASASVGSVLGVLLGGMIAARWGWQAAFGVVGVPGLVLALLYLKVRDYKTVELAPAMAAPLSRKKNIVTPRTSILVGSRLFILFWIMIAPSYSCMAMLASRSTHSPIAP